MISFAAMKFSKPEYVERMMRGDLVNEVYLLYIEQMVASLTASNPYIAVTNAQEYENDIIVDIEIQHYPVYFYNRETRELRKQPWHEPGTRKQYQKVK